MSSLKEQNKYVVCFFNLAVTVIGIVVTQNIRPLDASYACMVCTGCSVSCLLHCNEAASKQETNTGKDKRNHLTDFETAFYV